MSRRRAVSVPVRALTGLADEFDELATLLRCASDLGRLARGQRHPDESDRDAAQSIVMPGEESELDAASLVDLAAAPDTILLLVRRRLGELQSRVEALVRPQE